MRKIILFTFSALCLNTACSHPTETLPANQEKEEVVENNETAISTDDNDPIEHWNAYCNERFDFCITYPKEFGEEGQSQNGDGNAFYSIDEKTEIRFWGHLIMDDINDIESSFNSLVNGKEYKTTYKIMKDKYFVFSGTFTKDGEEYIYYIKAVEKEGNILNWSIQYPTVDKERYNPYCEVINKDLK